MAPRPFDPDPAQQRVLDHQTGRLLVTGPAGTGKTTVLRERFARLIEDGADPERVALVVRSKRDRAQARDALLDRLQRGLPDLPVFTVHALAFHVLGARYPVLGYTEAPRVLSAADQFAKVRELLAGEVPSEWPAYAALLPLRGFADQVRQFLLRAQEALVAPEDILERSAPSALAGWRELALFYRRYLDVLGGQGAVDFAGLVAQAARAAEGGQPPFDHLLVDDHQDSTFGVERLVTAIGAADLVVAGNLQAHVFSFQGTTDEPLRRFADLLPAERVELETRHRGEPAPIEGWRAPHVSEEHAAVARELRRIHVDDGVPWSRLAAVARRQGTQVAGLVRALDDAGVPHTPLTSGLSAVSAPATFPYVLGLRWLAAGESERDELVEAVLTSDLAGLSPAAARALLRHVRAEGRPAREAIDADEGLAEDERSALQRLREVLTHVTERRRSVLDAFAVLWLELPCSAVLVGRSDADHVARMDLEAVVAFARAIEQAGASADPSIEAFLASLQAQEGAPELADALERGRDAVLVLTAHATAGLELDTVFVVGAVEGDFPSLSRPEPMFDLSVLEATRSRADVNRARLADERRLFGVVVDRAVRRVVLTSSEPEGEDPGTAAPSRFAEERDVLWTPAPGGPFDEPVSVAEAAATWRRSFADAAEAPSARVAALDGLLALGADPSRWWFLHDWSGADAEPRETLHLSYSRLGNLENCELQYVLGDELGLDTGSGYQAWVGHLIHSIIERCERGEIARTPEAFVEEVQRQWRPERFPSYAISEAERAHATLVLVPNWFERYAALPAAATEQRFTFGFDGAVVNGVIDRIGPVPEGGTRITDYKTGKSDNADRPAENLQLGIYYLAVSECDDLAEHRPVSGVELAFLGGKRGNTALDLLAWPVSERGEEEYKQRMRARLTELVGRVRGLEASGLAMPSTAANCRFCGFQTLCSRYPEGGPVFPAAAPVEEPA